MKKQSRTMASSGILAALAIICMAIGTIIPVATYVCPVTCMLILRVVLNVCGGKSAWAWYGAVSILSILLAPDKEAALIFAFLGYYPIVKSWFDIKKGKWLLKILFFNSVIMAAYYLMIFILGIDQVVEDLSGPANFITVILLLLGNITFFLLDKLLSMQFQIAGKEGNDI